MSLLKRASALALALALALGCLSGCGRNGANSSGSSDPAGFSSADPAAEVDLSKVVDPFLTAAGLSEDTVVATVGQTEITAGQLLYWIAANADNMLNYYGGYYGITELPWEIENEGVTLADSMKENALSTAALYALIPTVGAADGLSLSQDFLDEFDNAIVELTDTLGGEELRNYYLWQFPLTLDLYASLCQAEEYNSMIIDKYYGEGSDGYPTDEKVISFLVDDQQCYYFKHILLLINETTAEDGTVASNAEEQLALAEDLLAQLRASDDPVALFDELMNEYSQDGGLSSYPDGYLGTASSTAIAGNVMVPVVEEAILGMKDWEISEVLENDGSYHGYHIVMRMPVAESVNAADYRDTYISYHMDQCQRDWLDANPIATNEVYDSIDAAAFYTALTALRTAVSEETAALEGDSSSAN